MWRYAPLYARADEAVSLGGGPPPQVRADQLGLGPLWFKDESRNPTWSFRKQTGWHAATAKKIGAKGDRVEFFG